MERFGRSDGVSKVLPLLGDAIFFPASESSGQHLNFLRATSISHPTRRSAIEGPTRPEHSQHVAQHMFAGFSQSHIHDTRSMSSRPAYTMHIPDDHLLLTTPTPSGPSQARAHPRLPDVDD
jgi:hypothetical protein